MNPLLERWLGLRFLDPAWLGLAVLVPLVLLGSRRVAAPALRLGVAPLLGLGARSGAGASGGPLPGSWRTALRALPDVLAAVGLLLLVVALARPAVSERVASPTEGIDLLLCLDTSSSMTARDMDARRTRLEVAKEAAAAFVRRRPDDRIGLVVFARYPDLVCPATRDHEALAVLLDGVRTVAADGPEDATGIGAAVARSAALLASSTARSRVVVLLTDGEENVAVTGAAGEIAPSHAAQLCARVGVRVYAVAAGTGRQDPTGAWRRPDTSAVEALARQTGGAFLAARDAAAMEAVYARVDALERAPADEPRHVTRDAFLPWLLAGLALLVAARLLGATLLGVGP